MVMCRLRQRFPEDHLANLFNVSTPTMSRIFITWVNFMYSKFGQINIWPSRETINTTMPESFKSKYKSTRVIIDCTEIRCQMPSSLQSGSMICLSLPLRMYSYTRFTSSALKIVFKPFPVSPRRFSQNLSSEFFNSSGFRPSRETPGISFSVRGIAFESLELSDVLAIFRDCGHPCVVNNKRRDATLAFLAFLASFSCCSNQVSRGVGHYESRVKMRTKVRVFRKSDYTEYSAMRIIFSIQDAGN